MFYYLYEIKNNVNGKIYVGVHKTDNLDDGYMGSGKIIKRAVAKYGIESFTKTILDMFDNSTDMFDREKEVVNDEFLLREDVYNLTRGGGGGFEYINRMGLNRHLDGTSFFAGNTDNSLKANKRLVELRRGVHAPDYINLGNPNANPSHMNTAIVNEKRKAVFAEIGHQQGEKNSQSGTMWITNGEESKKIKNTDTVPDGFRKGRKMKTIAV